MKIETVTVVDMDRRSLALVALWESFELVR